MSSVQGVVQKGSGEGKKFKGRTYYSFNVDGEWYRTGLDDPEINEGDMVKFDYEVTQYGNQVDITTLKKKKGQTPVVYVSQGKSAVYTSKKDKGDSEAYWQQKTIDDRVRQNTISYQAATNSAIEIVKEAIAQGGVPLGSKKADKLDLLVDAVLDTADRLYGQYLIADERVESIKSSASQVAEDKDEELPPIDDSLPEPEEVSTDDEDWD